MTSEELLTAEATLPGMRTKERTEFGDRLFKARNHAKLSQQELADAVGLSQNNVSHLELHGLGSPKVSQIARACGVRVEWLSDNSGSMLAEDSDEAQAHRVAETLAPYSRGAGADYRTIVHTLADALEEVGTVVTVRQFVKMADLTYRKFTS